MKKNNLDEMQDRKLLKLEEYGFWIMFWIMPPCRWSWMRTSEASSSRPAP